MNLNDHGAGSLRQAIVDANGAPDANVIRFNVAGTIRLTTGALPAITAPVDIDGRTAPGFRGTPMVEIDYNGFGGLQINSGAAHSTVRSLGLVRANDNGITINGGGHHVIVGNFIGLKLNGTTAAGNRQDGVKLIASHHNTIGGGTALERNIISGNRNYGVELNGANNNEIVGNYIGTDRHGTGDRGNGFSGIVVTSLATGNVIGGATGNLISGNDAHGVLINDHAHDNTVSGNRIGLTVSGNAVLGNNLDGVKVQNADHNLIGHSDPVTGVSYYNADAVAIQPVTAWQGIRVADSDEQYLIVGTSNGSVGNNGLLYEGSIDGTTGTSYLANFPGTNINSTSVYGPDNLEGDLLRLVGSYKKADFATATVAVHGFLFEGTTAELTQRENWTTVDYVDANNQPARYNFVHSTMGGLAVGNYDSPILHGTSELPLGPGAAYIYDISSRTFVTNIQFPGSTSNTAYGIWQNSETSFTICGGFSTRGSNNFDDQDRPIGQAYLVDYNYNVVSGQWEFHHWKAFNYPNGIVGHDYVTHFEGISSVEKGVYTLSADSLQTGSGHPPQGSLVTVRRQTNPEDSLFDEKDPFGDAVWVDLNVPGNDPVTNITSSNSVIGNQVVGVVIGPGGTTSYQATVNTGFQLSNVISGNGGNGVGLYSANDNQVSMNFIGTDVSGGQDLGNAGNGILVTRASSRNLIGGQATGGNDPTNSVFVRPPQGNLISGNNANGVLLNGSASNNLLSGNFIGTSASGNSEIGNSRDGVLIESANDNAVIGCTQPQDPFVFYNVISGNGGNGMRVNNSNNITIQANFFGMGADNDTPVGNLGSGLVVEGTSANTVFGGVIPLGNVTAANKQNGVVVRDRANGFVSFNAFNGVAAFSDNQTLGNKLDGFLITSTGGNNILRTNVISSNGDDGVEISGAARGVQVVQNMIGVNTPGTAVMGNGDNGVEIGGSAHHNIIGGPQPTFSVIPQNVISGNGGNGVAVLDRARDNQVNFSYIGTNVEGNAALGNLGSGVFLGPGTQSTTIGSPDSNLPTVISGNGRDGVEMRGTTGNTLVGSLIGSTARHLGALPNRGDGVRLTNSFDNNIGVANGAAHGLANVIVFNGFYGVNVVSGRRNGIHENSIFGNVWPGIRLGVGSNRNQAVPVLTQVQAGPNSMRITGTLSSRPLTKFTIEFFGNSASEASGRIFLGTLTVQTNFAGIATFNFLAPRASPGIRFITATATDPGNNTSRFSAQAEARHAG